MKGQSLPLLRMDHVLPHGYFQVFNFIRTVLLVVMMQMTWVFLSLTVQNPKSSMELVVLQVRSYLILFDLKSLSLFTLFECKKTLFVNMGVF